MVRDGSSVTSSHTSSYMHMATPHCGGGWWQLWVEGGGHGGMGAWACGCEGGCTCMGAWVCDGHSGAGRTHVGQDG